MKKVIMYFSLSLCLVAEQGDFVRDVKIPPLEFQIPRVQKTTEKGISWYELVSRDIPLAGMDIVFHGSENMMQNKPVEIPDVLAATLLHAGSKNHPGVTLQGEIEKIGGRIGVSSTTDSVTISLSFMTEDTKQVLQLLRELLESATLDEAVMADVKSRMTEELKRRNERTEKTGFRRTKELVFHGFTEGRSATLESLQKVSREDIASFYKFLVKDARKSVLLFGNLDSGLVKSSLTQSLVTGKSTDYTEEVVTYEKLKKSFHEFPLKNLFVEKDVSQSFVMLTGILPPHNHEDFYPVIILNYILGGGGFNSYFMTKIRTERGLAYSSVSYPKFSRDYGVLYAYTLTKTESTAEVLQLMREILGEKTIAAISEREIADAKNAITNKFIFLFSEDSGIIRDRLRFDEDKMPENYLQIYRKKISEVTREDLLRVAPYFYSKNLKTVIVGNKKVMPQGFHKVMPEEKF